MYIAPIDRELTLLMMAARYGRGETLQHLLGPCGAEVDVADKDGNTALVRSCVCTLQCGDSHFLLQMRATPSECKARLSAMTLGILVLRMRRDS